MNGNISLNHRLMREVVDAQTTSESIGQVTVHYKQGETLLYIGISKGLKSFIISSPLYRTEAIFFLFFFFLVYSTIQLPLSVVGLWRYVVSLTAGIDHHMPRAAVNMKVFIPNKNYTGCFLCSNLLNGELIINIIQYCENHHTPSPLWHMFDYPCFRALECWLWSFEYSGPFCHSEYF